MSRSRRKHSYHGVTCSRSEEWDKKKWHRAYRHACDRMIRKGEEDMPDYREYSDPWGMDKDGKLWFDPEECPKLMRK